MRPKITITLAAADLERERPNLERASIVAPGVTGHERGAFCDLELVFPSGESLPVAARAVLTMPGSTIFAFDEHDRAALARCLAAPGTETVAGTGTVTETGTVAGTVAETGTDDAATEEEENEPLARNVHERLRGLSVAEQLRVAREGSVTERVVLERLYSKIVWEALLRNPRITVPEVARLAKMGTMPRPLLELVVGNAAWLQVPQIRRALLSNPRLSKDMVLKVLLLLPREELLLVPQAAAYPPAVRTAAKLMVKR